VLKQQYVDGVVVDFALADIAAIELVAEIHAQAGPLPPPIVIYSDSPVSQENETQIRDLGRLGVVRFAESAERLLEETVLLLHRAEVDLSEAQRETLAETRRRDVSLKGKKVLVVDDDVRNIFALSSVLERRGMTVLTAGTGREAITTLESTPDVAIVLMDIMMPEMDGYETMQVIRQNAAFRRLPIIALTAKAMKGDREKCLEAGASEYLAKPVNTDQLLAALRMWLHR